MILNVMTFNIQHGLEYILLKQGIRHVNLEHISNIIKENNIDICGINEIYDYSPDKKERNKQINKISELSSIPYFNFSKAINVRCDNYGNAFLSKFEIIYKSETVVFSPEEKTENVFYEDRVLTIYELNINNININVLVTHFGLAKAEQEKMYNLIIEKTSKLNKPFILMGDFNMTPDNTYIQEFNKLFKNVFNNNEPTYPSIDPKIRIDYIYVSKDIEVIDSKIIKEIASDHFPLYAKIKIGD